MNKLGESTKKFLQRIDWHTNDVVEVFASKLFINLGDFKTTNKQLVTLRKQ